MGKDVLEEIIAKILSILGSGLIQNLIGNINSS